MEHLYNNTVYIRKHWYFLKMAMESGCNM